MGRITVVNLTNSSLQSAITLGGVTYSAANGIPSHVYYHHNAAAGTGYKVWEKWYIAGFSADFENTNLGSYISGVLIAVAGLAATIPAIVALPWQEFQSAIDAIDQKRSAAATAAATLVTAKAQEEIAHQTFITAFEAYRGGKGSEAAMMAAMNADTNALNAMHAAQATADASAALVTFAAIRHDIGDAVSTFVDKVGKKELGVLALGGLVGVAGIGVAAGTPLADYAAKLNGCSVDPVWGGEDKILSFTGNIPLKVSAQIDANGKTTLVPTPPDGVTADSAPPPAYAGYLTWEKFDEMRRDGEIYQVKDRNGKYGDMTQGLVRLNLAKAGGKKNLVTHAGLEVDISKIYKIYLIDSTNKKTTSSCLMAGEDEGDFRVYLRKGDEDQGLSCCFWQFIPTREQGGGWLLVDRRYGRFLYWSGSEILQYQSEEVGKAGIEIDENGWAQKTAVENEKGELINRDWPKGMVWNLQPGTGLPGHCIAQPGKDQVCVTGRTDFGYQIYARPYNPHDDVFQTWAVTAAN